MIRSRRHALSAVTVALLGASIIGYGCGGDDSNGDGDDTKNEDAGSTLDGSLVHDGSTTSDSGDANAGDAGAPPHLVFVTSASFTGNLIGEAAAIEADAGKDSGLSSDAGDASVSYIAATDTICNSVAKSAGLPGTYAAIISAGSDALMSRFSDADGPWSRTDGAPVADTLSDLLDGKWSASIDHTETGVDISTTERNPWTQGFVGEDCKGWTSADAAAVGAAGSNTRTSSSGIASGPRSCDVGHPLYCAQVGVGAGPNRFQPVPAGGKIAFVAVSSVPTNFALPDAGALDGSAPNAGDAVHTVGDAICNQAARGAGRAGTFRAWLSSTTQDAKSHFSAHAMNGPWYRPDGARVAATLTDLVTTGANTQVELGADGLIVPDLGGSVITGTLADGTLAASENCADFTLIDLTSNIIRGSSANKNTTWASGVAYLCSAFPYDIYCFEE